ncbi:MAG TPA: hypothetical protein VND19_14260 [Acetobacteraceae bacterium]|nr:hypothetical protein [Acetobacteraceae bacterium]
MGDYRTFFIDSGSHAVADHIQADVAAINGITAVSMILEVICRTTGMGFAAVARVTEDRWIACKVRDEIRFGLQAGDELTHLIHRISRSRIDSEQAMEPGAPHPRQGDPHFSPYLSGARG